MVADALLGELESYGRALSQHDREIYTEMLNMPLKHFGSIAYANSMQAWALMLLSIMLEQQKKIRKLEAKRESMANGRLQEG